MKPILSNIAFTAGFCISVVAASAQDTTYLLLEYTKVKAGTTMAYPDIEKLYKKIQVQRERDSSILDWTVWAVVSPRQDNEYEYVVATLYNKFNDYLGTYFYNNELSKDSVTNTYIRQQRVTDSVQPFLYQILAKTGMPPHLPKYLVKTEIRTAPGKAYDYESMELREWMPIHKDLIKKGYESAYNFGRLIAPLDYSMSNYTTFLFFDDENMFDKQHNIDWSPYMKANQAAFINSGILRTETHSEILTLLASLNHENKSKKN